VTAPLSPADVLAEIEASGRVRIALDVEGDSFYRYGERLCLVQIAFAGNIRLLDPCSEDLSPVFARLESRNLVLHGADFDLRLLHARYGFAPASVFDTMLAARFMNFPKFGLSDLMERYFGVTLEKKHQRADWCRRPLSEELLVYARLDVERLEEIGDRLAEELAAAGRLEWHREECAQVLARTIESAGRDADPESWRVKGGGGLSRRELAYLKELAAARDGLARRQDRALFRIFSAEDLVRLARLAAVDPDTALRQFPRALPGGHISAFGEALAAAKALEPAQWPLPPAPGRRPDPALERRLEKLRQRRDAAAAGLALEPSFLASRAALVRVAAQPPSSKEDLARLLESRWRAQALAEALLGG
jgi:ribonuclease D